MKLKMNPSKLIGIIIWSALLIGCSPAARLRHLIKKHPELVRTDTILTTYYDTVPSIDGEFFIKADTSVSGLDIIFKKFNESMRGKMDSMLALNLKKEVRNYVINRPLFPDTITKTVDGVTIKIFQQGESVGIDIHKPQEVKEKKVPLIINSVQPVPEIAWYYKGALWFFFFVMLFLILWGIKELIRIKIK